ncbi:hypothetical protein GCM10023093_05380 [Nemorincola caseinilytica]|uniref:CinA C-terminal domain-containing protein n=1 Tax=Nemorincola caseinilytica TaxID=2054315 RepID=A0ABP8N8Q6_9BACT
MLNEKKSGVIRDHLVQHEETVSVAESVTSGALQFLLCGIADAERFYQGGITAYNIGQKYRHLRVEPIHAKAHNCVSAKVAEQMAVNVCGMFDSDWGIGVTGYATPVPVSGNKLFCYFAVSYKGIIQVSEKVSCKKMLPEKVQHFFARKVMDAFYRYVLYTSQRL